MTKQLDELSDDTLKSYMDKSKSSMRNAGRRRNAADNAGDSEKTDKEARTLSNRYSGRVNARARLHGKFDARVAKNEKGAGEWGQRTPGGDYESSSNFKSKKYHAEEYDMNEDEINEAPRKRDPAGSSSDSISTLRYKASHTSSGAIDPGAHKLVQRERHKESARFKRQHPEVNWEEYDMNEDEEYMEPQVSELVSHSIDQRPLDFQQSFADLMQQRIEDAVHEKKLEIAAGFVTGANTDPSDDDYGDFEDDDSDVDDDSDESDVESEEEDENA